MRVGRLQVQLDHYRQAIWLRSSKAYFRWLVDTDVVSPANESSSLFSSGFICCSCCLYIGGPNTDFGRQNFLRRLKVSGFPALTWPIALYFFYQHVSRLYLNLPVCQIFCATTLYPCPVKSAPSTATPHHHLLSLVPPTTAIFPLRSTKLSFLPFYELFWI